MKTIAILLAFLFCINLNAQKGKPFLSSWHKNVNDAAGIISEDYSYYKKGKLYYFLSNDNSNIYIDLKIVDQETQTGILKQGLTIWVNMDSKLTKKMGIRFPVGSQNSAGRKKSGIYEDNTGKIEDIVTLLSLANKIELVGFTSEEARRFPAENADNFRGSIKCDKEGTLHYTLVMPIEKLPLRNSKEGDGAMPFTIGIEYSQSSARAALPTVLFWIKNFKLVTEK